ncbi:ribulose-phosphate 3-epimerase [Clostridium sp. AN503]|uniref:ribulose-phosphate 3-epimerase n=1 Tax=Clostridium sp. AN503 TaxID=3160598 RepID=UPI003458E517
MSKKLQGKISASMMCADLVHLKEDIELFEAMNIDFLHIDVMDGAFVPNYGLGVDYIRGLHELTHIPLDIHLMVEKPEDKLSWFKIKPEDSVTIHYESTPNIQRALVKARAYDCSVRLAINPGTPICLTEELLRDIDGITLLTVNPGFAGQKIVPGSFEKMEKLTNYLIQTGYEDMSVQVDGNISFNNAKQLRICGADFFVAGTSSIFEVHNSKAMKQNIHLLREMIQ